MTKTHVAVLMGGISSEHAVSLNSGAKVAANLDRSRYDVTPTVITQDGLWEFDGRPGLPIHDAVAKLRDLEVDVAFLALHGPFGEDGRIQGMLDVLGLSYTGSGCVASAIAIDKVRCKALVEADGVRVARQVVLTAAEWRDDAQGTLARVERELGFPCVMKSPCQGSSLGMSIPRTPDELRSAMPRLLELDEAVMIEEYLAGAEVTCGVLDVEPGRAPRPLPVTEICPVDSTFFDYEAKYTPGACEEITPARISEAAAGRVQEMAARVHTVVGCKGLSRSDMILIGPDEPVWLEVNTIPGMTETSLFPQAAAAVGISYPELVGMLVEAAVKPR